MGVSLLCAAIRLNDRKKIGGGKLREDAAVGRVCEWAQLLLELVAKAQQHVGALLKAYGIGNVKAQRIGNAIDGVKRKSYVQCVFHVIVADTDFSCF